MTAIISHPVPAQIFGLAPGVELHWLIPWPFAALTRLSWLLPVALGLAGWAIPELRQGQIRRGSGGS